MKALVFAFHEMGCVGLEALLDAGWEIAGVVTHPDSPGEHTWFRSVAALARARGIPLWIEDDPNRPPLAWELASLGADWAFSFYFRKMLGSPLLACGRRGALNLHGSLLPKYRGRCPINWVLVNGEAETGVTLHHMDLKPDHGDLVGQRAVAIDHRDTALSLYGKLASAARGLLGELLPRIADGTAPRIPQDHARSSYYGGRTPADGRIDWAWPAARIANLVRAVAAPWPGAFVDADRGKLVVWAGTAVEGAPGAPGELVRTFGGLAVATGRGAFRPDTVQLDGWPVESWEEFTRSRDLVAGLRIDADAYPRVQEALAR